jgi:pimeloyl-ACP methyl ester carboxylesterase
VISLNRKNYLLIGLAIIGAVTTAIYLFNRFFHSSSTKNFLLSEDDGLFYNWKLGSVFYTKIGQGRPLLLVHDLNSFSSGYEWHKVIEQLSRTNTVYTLDLLGCGRSDKPSISYTSYLYVQLITDFISNVIGEPTKIIVTGSSGAFVMETSSIAPTLVDKIILINPKDLDALATTPRRECKVLRNLLTLPLLGTFIYNLLVNKNTLAELIKTVYFNDPQKATDTLVETYLESSQKNETKGKFLYASIISKLTYSNLFHSLTRVSTPVFIVSSQGIPHNLHIATEYQDILPSIIIREVENSNYLPQLEEPNKFLEQVYFLLS